MTALTLDSAVGDWAAQRPAAIDIFQKYGIDFCCHGRVSLAVACCERGLDPLRVVKELDQAPAAGIDSGRDWSLAALADLCDHIERAHHAYLREQLPRLADWLDKVVAAHANRHPELADVRRAFHELRGELEPHMLKEERILFPAIRALERAASPPAFPFGSVRSPIGVMEDEHELVSVLLARLRELTRGYQALEDACGTYRALLDGLRRLEADLHVHIHKENNILFPRAASLESSEPAALRV